MPTDFDPIRQAPLPDSFDRTADWLRSAPPPSTPARPIALVVALALLVGACAIPVASDAVVGWAVEVTAPDGLEVVRALDAVVSADERLSADVAPRGDGEAVLYVVLEDGAAERARAAMQDRGLDVRVRPLGLEVRQPLGLVAARWLGVSGSPNVPDADLQLALDRAFAGHDLAPRVERDADGRRVLTLNDAFRINGLDPETRIARRGSTISITGGDLSGLEVGGIPIGDLGRLESAGFRHDLKRVLDSLNTSQPAGGHDLEAVTDSLNARWSTGISRLEDDDPAVRAALESILDDLPMRADSVRGFLVRVDSINTP